MVVLDRRLLVSDELLQLANHPLAVGQALRRIGTSLLHALVKPRQGVGRGFSEA